MLLNSFPKKKTLVAVSKKLQKNCQSNGKKKPNNNKATMTNEYIQQIYQTEKVKYNPQKIKIDQSMFYYSEKIKTATNPIELQIYNKRFLSNLF